MTTDTTDTTDTTTSVADEVTIRATIRTYIVDGVATRVVVEADNGVEFDRSDSVTDFSDDDCNRILSDFLDSVATPLPDSRWFTYRLEWEG
jgi:hypothetical protein